MQCHDEEAHLHRMILCRRDIDEMRQLPEDEWDITVAGLPVYWVFPNVILLPFAFGMFVVRAIPAPGDVGSHISKIDFYGRPDAYERAAERFGIADFEQVAEFISQTFAGVIRDEDYVMAASQQAAANAGALDEVVFGRNEPTLHHYHNTFRNLLGQEPLQPY